MKFSRPFSNASGMLLTLMDRQKSTRTNLPSYFLLSALTQTSQPLQLREQPVEIGLPDPSL